MCTREQLLAPVTKWGTTPAAESLGLGRQKWAQPRHRWVVLGKGLCLSGWPLGSSRGAQQVGPNAQ